MRKNKNRRSTRLTRLEAQQSPSFGTLAPWVTRGEFNPRRVLLGLAAGLFAMSVGMPSAQAQDVDPNVIYQKKTINQLRR